MLVSQFVSGVSAEFSLVRSGNQVTASLYYGLTGYYDEDLGYYLWDGEIGASIGTYGDYLQQTADRPMDLQFVATLVPGANTAASYFVNDNIGGAAFDREFNIVLFDTAVNYIGSSAADLVFGSAAADTFRSVGAGDMFEGGAGNDIYSIYSSDTQVFEAAGEGTADRVAAGVSYTLAEGVEVELLTTTNSTGTAAIDLTGNKLQQEITGNAGDNVLSSGGRNVSGLGDILRGRAGDDTYRVYNAADLVVEAAGSGTDRVIAAASYHLAQGAEVELLTTNSSTSKSAINLDGNELSQTIIGNAGNNRIADNYFHATTSYFNSSADVLRGLGGDDNYLVTNAGTTIVEGAGGGNDVVTVQLGLGDVSPYVLDANAQVETLQAIGYGTELTGNRYSTAIKGSSGNDTLSYAAGQSGVSYTLDGGAGNDTLIGGAGDNILIGGEGDDVLRLGPNGGIAKGGNGNDHYIIESATNNVLEDTGGGSSVGSFFTFALPDSGSGLFVLLELLGTDAIDGTGNELNNRIDGNSSKNTLTGLDGNDYLDGHGGGDTLDGGKGDDTYYARGNETFIEAAGNGFDTIITQTQNVVLAANAEIEVIKTSNASGNKALNMTGSDFAQTMTGNRAANILDGGGGDDILWGLEGSDTLYGRGGADTFVFNDKSGSFDTIADFSSSDGDTIALRFTVFPMLFTEGVLKESAFRVNSTGLAEDADDRLIYNSTTGELFYDSDGAGSAATVKLAVLTGIPALTAASFESI
jgi:Ca2+-binding RTX toxin-like protein